LLENILLNFLTRWELEKLQKQFCNSLTFSGLWILESCIVNNILE